MLGRLNFAALPLYSGNRTWWRPDDRPYYQYWFPKALGFRLDESWGKRAFWAWIIGFYLAFMPLYVLGFMGMPRRLERYDAAAWQTWLMVAELGAVVILLGIILLMRPFSSSSWPEELCGSCSTCTTG